MRLVLAVLLVLCLCPTPRAQPARPNVVILLVDDQGWADIGYNNARVYSPRLDALASESLVFTRHYVMPQCTPTRVALMTGRYPSRFGGAAQQASNAPAFPLGTPTMPSLFKRAGYATHLVGKWHLGSTRGHGPNEFGFDSSYGSLAGAVGMYDHRYRAGEFEHTWHRDGVPIEGGENGTHATDLVTREAVRIIEDAGEKPFFLYVAFQSVHTPLDERGRFTDEPTALDPDHPDRWRHEDEIEWFHDPEGLIQRETDPEKRLFLAAVHHLDAAVGEIIDALGRTGQRERTLILFSSDNGPQVNWAGDAYPDDLKLTDFNQPDDLRGAKIDVWEGGIRVPGLANWPGRIEAGESDALVHIVDWLPTLASIVSTEPAGATNLDGADLSAILFDHEADELPDRDLYWTWASTTNRWALRHGDWKIVHYGRPAPESPSNWQLFNLANDPREQTDLAAERPEVLQRMHERYLVRRAGDAP